MFSLFKMAELGSAKRNFHSGVYSWEKVPEIANAFSQQFDVVNLHPGGWLWELLGVAVFDLLEQMASPRLSRDDVLSSILSDSQFTGKSADAPEVRQELGTRMRMQSGAKSATPDQVLATANSPNGLSNLSALLSKAGMPLEEAHTYIELAAEVGPDSFLENRTISSFVNRVRALREERARSAPKSTALVAESSNPIMEYIKAHPRLDADLTIEGFGATYHSQTNPKAREELEARCLAEQNEGGGVCVHSVHLNKVLGGISLFASVRNPKREHVATIKFEDNLVYEIKGHNNRLVANQLEISEDEKQLLRSAVQKYISKMLSDGIADGFSQQGEADFANLMHPDEIKNIVSGGTEDYSSILPSHKMTSAQIETIWSRIRSDPSRISEFAAMAGNKNTPPEIQAELLAMGNKAIDSALSRNENLDPALHDQLSQHGDRLVRHRALAHPLGYKKDISQDEIIKMLSSRDSKVVARAAASPLAPREKLLELGTDPLTDPNIKTNLLINPNLKLEIKQMIFETMPTSAQESVLLAPHYGAGSKDIVKLHLPESYVPGPDFNPALARFIKNFKVLKSLVNSNKSDSATLKAVAMNPRSDEELLKLIAKSEKADDHVIKAVALNRNAGAEFLESLVNNEKLDDDILEAVASNPNISTEFLKSIINSDRAGIYALRAIGRGSSSAEVLSFIINSEKTNSRVLEAVASNPNISTEFLKSLINNEKADAFVLTKIMRNPNTSAELLKLITESDNVNHVILLEMIYNPKSDAEVIESVLKSKKIDKVVVQIIYNNPKTDPETRRLVKEMLPRYGINYADHVFPLFKLSHFSDLQKGSIRLDLFKKR